MKTWTIVLASILLAGAAFADDTPMRVNDDTARQAVITKVAPEYPALAKQMRLTGHVVVEAIVDTQGNVEKTNVVSGNALLSSAAVAALKKWKFTPFNGPDGKPTKAVVAIGFDFKP